MALLRAATHPHAGLSASFYLPVATMQTVQGEQSRCRRLRMQTPTNPAATAPPPHRKELSLRSPGRAAGLGQGSGWQDGRHGKENVLRGHSETSFQGSKSSGHSGRWAASKVFGRLGLRRGCPAPAGAGRGLTAIGGIPQARGPVRCQPGREQVGPSLLVQVGSGSGLGSNEAWGGASPSHWQTEARHP